MKKKRLFTTIFLLIITVVFACVFLVACVDDNEQQEEKFGSVTGEITYKYNDFVGHRADTDSTVYLISKSIKSLPNNVAAGATFDLPEGVYVTTVSGTGRYNFDRIPVGKYYLVMMSKNTNEDRNEVVGEYSWGQAFNLFSEEGKEVAMAKARLDKTRTTIIEVFDGQTTTYSYDFGITYSTWL